MELNYEELINGLLMWLAFVALVVLHEWAHAWTAERCGDDTPRLQGRVTFDPLAHIDPIGTVILPLLVVFMGAMGNGTMFIFGWGRPVQVNIHNFRRRRFDDILVSAAVPAMNLLLAVVILGIAKIVQVTHGWQYLVPIFEIAILSLFLCFFNLLPIPPLDGGHIMRNLVGMSDEAYHMMSQYSFLFLLIVMRSPEVGAVVNAFTSTTFNWLRWPFQFY